MAVSSDDILAAGGGTEGNGETVFWHVQHGEAREIQRISHAQFVRSISFPPSNDESNLVALTEDFSDGEFALVDYDTGEIIRRFNGHASKSMPCTFDTTGKRLITGSDDRTLKFWDTQTGELRGTLEVGERIRSIRLIGNQAMVVGTREGFTRVYELTE